MSYSPTLGRWAETDPAEYIDGPNMYQMELSNPISMVDPTGTDALSDDDVAGIVYNETSLLRPAWKDPNGPHRASNYDPNSVQRLQDAREKIAEIARKRGGQGVASPKIPNSDELKNDDVRRAWESAQQAAKDSKGKDCGNSDHFVLWPSSDHGKSPTDKPKIPADWPYSEKDKISKSYGPFRKLSTSGDVPPGDDIYIFIYTGVQ